MREREAINNLYLKVNIITIHVYLEIFTFKNFHLKNFYIIYIRNFYCCLYIII